MFVVFTVLDAAETSKEVLKLECLRVTNLTTAPVAELGTLAGGFIFQGIAKACTVASWTNDMVVKPLFEQRLGIGT